MKIKTVTLNNFQSYKNETISFKDGVSLIHGDNGAGKSTILRAIFGGLFQTKMRDHASSDFDSIGQLVRTGEEEGGVTVTFEVGGETFVLEWVISVNDPTAEEPTGSTKSCTLESSNYGPVSGVRNVRSAITNDIIGMDARAFVNSVYVQQNQVMKLITASEKERKEIFDELLGLSQIDTYINRTVELRREAKNKRDKAKNGRDELQVQLDEDYPSRDSLSESQQTLATDRDEVRDQLTTLKKERDELLDEIATLEDQISGYNELQAEQRELNEQINNLESRITKLQGEKSELTDEQNELQREKYQQQANLSNLETDREVELTDKTAVSEARDTVEAEQVDATKHETEVKQQLEQRKTELQKAQENHSELTNTAQSLENKTETLEEKRDQITQKIRNLTVRLSESKEKRDEFVRNTLPADSVPSEFTQETCETAIGSYLDTKNAEREEKTTQIASISTKIENQTAEVERLTNEIASVEAERQDALQLLPAEIQTRATDSETNGSIVSELVAEASQTAERIEAELTVSPETLREIRQNRIPEIQHRLDGEYVETVEDRATVSSQQEQWSTRIEEFESIEETGVCPVCEEEVSSSHDHSDTKEELTTQLEKAGEKFESLDSRVAKLSSQREALSTLRTEIGEALLVQSLHSYDEELDELRAQKSDSEAKIEALEEQKTTVTVQVDTLEEEINSVETEFDTLTNQVESTETKLTTEEDRLETVETDIDSVESERDQVEQELETVTTRIDTLEDEVARLESEHADAKQKSEQVKSELTTLKKAAQFHTEKKEAESRIESIKAEIKSKNETVEALNQQIADADSRLDDVEAKVEQTDTDEIEDRKHELEQKVGSVKTSIQTAKNEEGHLTEQIAKVENKIESYDALSQRIQTLDKRVNEANDYVEEMNTLIETYESVKFQLRQENIKLINAYANEVFRELYQSQSYERIILGDDYAIRLVKSNGSRVSPQLSSGGESAIVNVALRAAIYRVIAERSQTNASNGLPPLILDEPTTFLDSGHVKELETVIESIKDWNVAQVLIVSHEPSLIDGADYEYYVEKDPTEDMSRCTLQNTTP